MGVEGEVKLEWKVRLMGRRENQDLRISWRERRRAAQVTWISAFALGLLPGINHVATIIPR